MSRLSVKKYFFPKDLLKTPNFSLSFHTNSVSCVQNVKAVFPKNSQCFHAAKVETHTQAAVTDSSVSNHVHVFTLKLTIFHTADL